MSRRKKTFFAATLEAALGQARRELGPEALLLAIDIEERLGNRRAADEYRSRLRREFPDSAAAAQEDGTRP